MFLEFLAHLVVTAALLLLVANAVRGVEIEGWGPAILAALVLGLVNAFVRPIMVLLTLPLTIVTFGVFLLVINALMLLMVGAMVPGVRIQGFGPALFGSLLLTLLNIALAALVGPGWSVA
jgi:putative membrane protein